MITMEDTPSVSWDFKLIHIVQGLSYFIASEPSSTLNSRTWHIAWEMY